MCAGVVSGLCWDPSSLYLVSAGGEDRHVRVWHNRAGMRELLRDLEAKLPKAASEPLKVSCPSTDFFGNC